jgi:hypothetical protein
LLESAAPNIRQVRWKQPVTVAERSKVYTVFARSEAGTMGSNPTQGMDVECLCVCVLLCLCTGRGLATS